MGEKTEKLPLTMGGEILGYIAIDRETGEFEGKLDSNLVEFLEESFGRGLMEMTFYGKPVLPIDYQEFRKKTVEFFELIERKKANDN